MHKSQGNQGQSAITEAIRGVPPATFDDLLASNSKLHWEISALKGTIRQLEGAMDATRKECDDKQVQIVMLSAELREANRKLEVNRCRASEVERLQKELNEKEGIINAHLEELRAKEQTNQGLRGEIATLKDEKLALGKEVIRLQNILIGWKNWANELCVKLDHVIGWRPHEYPLSYETLQNFRKFRDSQGELKKRTSILTELEQMGVVPDSEILAAAGIERPVFILF